MYRDDNNTPERCGSECYEAGYTAYFAVQDGFGCWCGNSLQEEKTLKDDSECNDLCSGDSSQFCGASWRNSLYQYVETVTGMFH